MRATNWKLFATLIHCRRYLFSSFFLFEGCESAPEQHPPLRGLAFPGPELMMAPEWCCTLLKRG